MAILPFDAFPFAGGTYQALSPIIDAERSINLYPERNPVEAKAPVSMIGRPGLFLFTTLPTSPVRALASGNGRMFAIAGTHFYEVNPTSGAVILNYGAIPGSSGTGPAKIIFGMVAGTPQLLILDSTSTICYPNPVGPTITSVFGGFDLEFMDGFYFALSNSLQNGINASAAGDGATWPGLAVAQRTTEVDAVNAVAKIGSNLWVFGQKTITPYYDAGTAPFPLAPAPGQGIQLGALGTFGGSLAAYHILKGANTVFWIGADDRGFLDFYAASGVLPVPISSPGIAPLVAGWGPGGFGQVRGFAYTEGGHGFCVWNFPNAPNSGGGLGATLCYDWTTKQWHERTYFNGATEGRWLADCFCSLTQFGNTPVNYVGDYSSGNIYKMGLQYTADNTQPINYARTCPIISNNNDWLVHGSFQLDADIGTATPFLYISDDGGETFPTFSAMQIVGTTAAEGQTRYVQHQLGRSLRRVYKVYAQSATQSVKFINAYVDVYK